MSFLRNYWNAVERAHCETGMNYGDIRIDPTTISREESTHVDNAVPATEPTNPPTPNRPSMDGAMPWNATPVDAKFESVRRSERPDERVQGMAETKESKIGEEGSNRSNHPRNKRVGRKGRPTNQKTSSPRKVPKSIRKIVKRMTNGNARVSLVCAKAVFNDRPRPEEASHQRDHHCD